jgi:hypothetical protein
LADSVLARIAIAPLRFQQHSSARQAQTRDRFATTPIALRLKDGIILSAKESEAAETPEP